MDLIANLSLGFGVAFTPINLLYAFIGCLLGTAVGDAVGLPCERLTPQKQKRLFFSAVVWLWDP